MNIIIDVVLAVIFIGIVLLAAKKGLVLSVLEVAAFVLAIIISAQLCAPMSNSIYDGFIEKGIEKKITESLPDDAQGATYAKKASAVLESIPSFYSSYAKKVGIDVDELSKEIMSADFSKEGIAGQLEEKVARPIVVSVMTGLVFIILCLLLMIILKVCARAISRLFNIPIIGTANRLLGALFGILKGAIIIIVISVVLTFIAPSINGSFKTAVDSSKIVSVASDLNPMNLSNE